MSHEIFICYAHADLDYAGAICNTLESEGLSCWIAPRDISPSKDWAAETIDAISSAVILILVFSSHSNDSPQVRREIERAVHKGVNILPFRIEDVPLSKSLEYFISTPHWLDAITPPFEGHLAELADCIKRLLNGPSSPCLDAAPSYSTPAAAAQKAIPHALPAGARTLIDARHLKYIEAQLAGLIGPIAKLLVSEAAEKTSSPYDLVTFLSGELALESEKKFFRENCLHYLNTL